MDEYKKQKEELIRALDELMTKEKIVIKLMPHIKPWTYELLNSTIYSILKLTAVYDIAITQSKTKTKI
jgi:hypothetical protein